MPKKRRKVQLPDYKKSTVEFWEESRQAIGPQKPLFLDTCGILSFFVERDDVFRAFLDSVTGFKLFTSSFVVAEAARRLVKSKTHDPFRGPGGIRDNELAIHIIETWLSELGIPILHVPSPVFDEGCRVFVKFRGVSGWDLVDAISVALIKGLGGEFIVSSDAGFRVAGLQLAPSNAYEVYCASEFRGFYE